MRFLLLGGGGFIGSHICDRLLKDGQEVRVFERQGCPRRNLLHLDSDIEWIEGDFTDPACLRKAVKGIDVIFHLISTTVPGNSNDNPVSDISSNVIPTLNLLDMAVQAGVRKVIFFSSGGTVYGIPHNVPITEEHPTNPTSSYGIHKLMIEKYLALYFQLYGLDYSILRTSNPYGENQNPKWYQGAIAVFIYKALKGETVEIWGDGSVVRDYIYVGDVVDAAIKASKCLHNEKIINIGSGTGLSLNDVLTEIETITGQSIDVRYSESRSFDVPVNILDISRAKRILDWYPRVKFTEGLKKTIDHFRTVYLEP